MSIDAMKWALQEAPIPHSQTHIRDRLVLVYLADRHNPDTEACWPSVGRIARDLGVSEPTVRNAIRELNDLGLISPASQHWVESYPKGRRPNVWQLHMDRVRPKDGFTPKDLFTPKDVLPPEGERGVSPSPKEVLPPGGKGSLPKPKENPKTTQTSNPKGKRSRSRRGTELSEGWVPDPHVVEAMREECPHVDLEREHRKFTDYFRGVVGEKGRKKDWNATWRNWIRRAAENAPRGGQAESFMDVGSRLAARLEGGSDWKEIEK